MKENRNIIYRIAGMTRKNNLIQELGIADDQINLLEVQLRSSRNLRHITPPAVWKKHVKANPKSYSMTMVS